MKEHATSMKAIPSNCYCTVANSQILNSRLSDEQSADQAQFHEPEYLAVLVQINLVWQGLSTRQRGVP